MTTEQLTLLEYNSFYQTYIDKASGFDLLSGFQYSMEELYRFFLDFPDDRLDYQYEEGKWTVKEVVQHLIDTERIFAYRALRIGRGDKIPLSGFDQDNYIEPSEAANRDFENLIREYVAVRKSTEFLFNNFPLNALTNKGVVNNSEISVRAIGFIILGHEQHHLLILKERYL